VSEVKRWLAVSGPGHYVTLMPIDPPSCGPDVFVKLSDYEIMAKDAARYRWLRDRGPTIRQEITASGFSHEVDARIDKAMAAEKL
jgi:hypothetical protein